MKFLRLGMLYFSPSPNEWDSFEVTMNGVLAKTLTIGNAPPIEGKLRILLVTEVTLKDWPTRDSEGYLLIPQDERRQCEEVIEMIANIIAVTGRCSRSISSPTPSAALVPENEDEKKFLDESKGVRSAPRVRMDARYKIELTEDIILGLNDRLDGVTLLAEALSHNQASGKYHDLVRLFELAFALPVNALEKKLSQYLTTANLGYTRDEVGHWLSFRHGTSHADLRKTSIIVVEADLRIFIARMEQAAVDVLFNKTKWHDSSRERRNLMKPLAATTAASGNIAVVQGSEITFINQIFDEFGAYPCDLQGILTPPPDDWWWKLMQEPINEDEKPN